MPGVFIYSSLLVIATHTSRLTALQTGRVRVKGVFSLPSALISLDCTPKTQPLSLQQQRAEWGAQLCQLSCGVSVKTFHVKIQIPVILTPSCTLCKRMKQIGKQANGHTPDVVTTCCPGSLSRLCNKYGNSTSFKTMENKSKMHLWENDSQSQSWLAVKHEGILVKPLSNQQSSFLKEIMHGNKTRLMFY